MQVGASLVRRYVDNNDLHGYLVCSRCNTRVDAEAGFAPCRCTLASWGGGNPDVQTISTSTAKSPGQNNARAAAGMFLHNWPNGRGILLHGSTGTGKTYLAHSIINEVIIKGASAALWHVAEVLDNCKRAINGDGTVMGQYEYYDATNTLGLLVLDDLASERPTGFAAEVLLGIVDRRSRSGKPLVITSNLAPEKLEAVLDERVFSRIMGMCEPVVMKGSDLRRRMNA